MNRCWHRISIILALLILFAITTNCRARTWYIKPDQTGDAPWIEAAIDSASSGDTILVAPGHYIENTLSIDKDIHIISECGANRTIIEMRLISNFNLNVMIVSGASSNSEVTGFTITGGRGTPLSSGAGIDLRNSSTSIKHNIIYDNWAQVGGGICCSGGSPLVRGNVIYGNWGGEGGGIHIHNSEAIVDSNTIAFNGITCDSVVTSAQGGAIFVYSTLPVQISNNIIAFNSALISGGIYCGSSFGDLIFTCNLVYGNDPDNYDGNIPDQTGINGNISANPHFCAIRPDSTNNFYVQSDSPCLPENHPDGSRCNLIGAWTMGCGAVGVREKSWGDIKRLYK